MARIISQVLVVGIDAVKPKNIIQYETLGQLGYHYTVITTDSTDSSELISAPLGNVNIVVISRRLARCSYIVSSIYHALRLKYKGARIVEVYPSGILSAFVIFFLRIMGYSCIVIARGEEWNYLSGRLSRTAELGFRLTYYLAHGCIYRELYAEEWILRHSKSAVLIPNSVALQNDYARSRSAFVSILYLNTFKPFRSPELVVEAFDRIWREYSQTNAQVRDARLILAGCLESSGSTETQEHEKMVQQLIDHSNAPIELRPYHHSVDDLYRLASVFVLPADIVFLNNSMLEAMSRGIPVLVQDTEDASLVFIHQVNGHLVEKSVDGWEQALFQIITNKDYRIRLGKGAKKLVEDNYSRDVYGRKYAQYYEEMTYV